MVAEERKRCKKEGLSREASDSHVGVVIWYKVEVCSRVVEAQQ